MSVSMNAFSDTFKIFFTRLLKNAFAIILYSCLDGGVLLRSIINFHPCLYGVSVSINPRESVRCDILFW